MDPLDPQFNDAPLRAAIGRAIGGESAPEALRHRVTARLDREDNLLYRWRKPLVALATAAVLLIGFGVVYMNLPQPAAKHPIPQFLASAMVGVHDRYAGNKTQLTITDSDLLNVRAQLETEVGHPVMLGQPGVDWTFVGADVVNISGIPAAHAVFTHNNQTVSIFSLPASVLYTGQVADGTSYEQMEKGHAISGIVFAGAVNCLVGSSTSGEFDLHQLTTMRDLLRPAMVMHLMHADRPPGVSQACN